MIPHLARMMVFVLMKATRFHANVRDISKERLVKVYCSALIFLILLGDIEHKCPTLIFLFLEPFIVPKPKPCDSSPCKNGATCTNEGDSFSCKCAENFMGQTCDTGTVCTVHWRR